jgi:hypothetical protein
MAFRDQIFTIKAEEVSGTLETLAAADVIRCGKFTPKVQDFTAIERTQLGVRPGTPQASRMTDKKTTFTVPFEWAGSGTPGTPSGINKICLAAGLNSAVVTSTSITRAPAWPFPATTYSVGTFVDGVRYAGAGALVSKLTIEAKAGQPLMGMADFVALYRAPLTQANPAVPNWPTQVDSVVFDSSSTTPGTCTLTPAGGSAVGLCFEEYTYTKENIYSLISNAGCLPYFAVTDYKISGTAKVARPAIATLDLFGIAESSTLCAMALPIGTTAGNIMTFNHPRIQLICDLEDNKDLPYISFSWEGRFGDNANQEPFIVET